LAALYIYKFEARNKHNLKPREKKRRRTACNLYARTRERDNENCNRKIQHNLLIQNLDYKAVEQKY
jgi:hypothetical protein